MVNLTFDWGTYYTLAKELAGREEEACLRSSLSRAYYYVFNIALVRAERNGFVFARNESTHAQLWRLYNKSPEPACISLGQIALRLKDKRERADYKAVYRRIEEDVPEVMKDVQVFAARLAELPPRLPSPSSVRQ